MLRDILGQAEEQQGAALVAKPVAEEQVAASHILREHQNDAGVDREEMRELRKFLKEPLVGAGVQALRRSLKAFSANGELGPLISTVRGLWEQQGSAGGATAEMREPRIRREDLHLVCYEYICS